MADKLELISITPNLAIEVKINTIKERIVNRLIELKLTDQKYKMSQDILLLVCNLAEHLISSKKINKKQLVVDVLNATYVLSATEKQLVEQSIEFLHSNGAIKKLSKFYLFCCGVYEFFSKKSKKG